MCNSFFKENNCTEYCDHRPEVVAKENKTTYKLINLSKKEVCKIKVDNCLIKEAQKKCDYLILNCSDQIAIFIEFKRGNIEEAFPQLDAAIKFLLPHLKNFKICVRIVASKVRTPALQSTAEKKLKNKLKTLNQRYSQKINDYLLGSVELTEKLN